VPKSFRKFAKGKREWNDVVALLRVRKRKKTPEQKPCATFSASPNKVKQMALRDRPAYGNPIDFHGLRHEPVNEQGVVLLLEWSPNN